VRRPGSPPELTIFAPEEDATATERITIDRGQAVGLDRIG